MLPVHETEVIPSLFLALISSLVVAQIYRYRRVSVPVERQQTKWVVFGLTVWIVMVVVVLLIGWIFALTHPGIAQIFYNLLSATVIFLSTLLIPLSIGVAIMRYRLWDIELIIKRTLVYGSLSTVLLLVYALTDELLENVFYAIFGLQQSLLTNVLAVLAVTIIFEPLRRRTQAFVDRFVQRRLDGDTPH